MELTNMNVVKFKFSYMWLIKNFSHCQEEVGELLKSPLFSSSNQVYPQDKWGLQIHPGGHDHESKEYLSLYLKLIFFNNLETKAKFRFSLLNEKGEETGTMESDKAHRFVSGQYKGFKKFIKRDFLLDKNNGILIDDKLIIFCEICIISEPERISGRSDGLQFNVPECQLKEEFDQLFQSQKFSDVTLSAGGQEFRAHKAILAGRSPVFSAMFEDEMKEGQLNSVVITEINSEVFFEVLRFIYTGKVINLENLANDLIYAADKYDLRRLKMMCEEFLLTTKRRKNQWKMLLSL